jgi:hypothetical protein
VFDDTEVSFGVSGVLLIGLGIADEVGFFISGFWAGCSGVSVPTGATLLFNDPVKVSSEFTASISRVSKVESVCAAIIRPLLKMNMNAQISNAIMMDASWI